MAQRQTYNGKATHPYTSDTLFSSGSKRCSAAEELPCCNENVKAAATSITGGQMEANMLPG